MDPSLRKCQELDRRPQEVNNHFPKITKRPDEFRFIGSFFTPKTNVNKVKMDSADKKPLAFGEKPIFSNQISESANKDNPIPF